jgi:hypothetical protein
MENLKRFTADQARELKRSCAERTIYERVMNDIYCRIKQACKFYNNCDVNLSLYSTTLVEKVIKTLLDDGYTVEFDYMSGIMTVRW